eukprot:TRINITY_DN56161_c0_g1_i1.p4 TRINITY_DN56161_c0_g1~~TRINITY_DN56161_c0_g1_i1.p4  ORF type:complete len:138 (+),score=31.02 TRINITY_DN56161_c0_g1_i1:32-415(+)
MFKSLAFVALVAAAAAHYEDSDVLVLDQDSFDSQITNSKSNAIVVFYAPWCGHCKRLVPEYKEAATKAKSEGLIVASVDCTAHQGLCQKFDVRGYPTIKVFPKNGGEAQPFRGARNTDAILSAVRSA